MRETAEFAARARGKLTAIAPAGRLPRSSVVVRIDRRLAMRNAGGLLVVSALIGIGLLPRITCPTTGVAGDATTHLRRPVALLLADDGKTLFVANRDSGSVAIVDT